MTTFAELRNRYAALAPRERRLVTWGMLAAVVIVLLGVLLPLTRAVDSAQSRVERKQEDLAWMLGVTPALQAAGPAPTAPESQESLVVLVDRAARESGLGGALTGSQPNGNGGLSVRLEKAPFNALVAWLARLSQQHGIRVVSATMDATGETGLVNAGIVLQTR